jgi:glycosyltransferase involved in cell wall biosynthesis
MSTRARSRVLHVESGQEWRATRDQVRLLVEALTGVPHVRQAVATLKGSRLAREVESLGVPVLPLPWTTDSDPRALRRLARAASADWDVLHAHDSQALRMLLYILALDGANAPVVASRRLSGLPRGRWKWRRARMVLAISPRARLDLLAVGVEAQRVVVVPNGIDVSTLHPQRAGEIRSRVGARPENLLIGSSAGLESDRDHGTLIEAAARVCAARPGVRFALLGEGSERGRLETRIGRLGLGGRVCLPGHVPGARHSMVDFDVFVHPSRSEELSTAALEALGAGVPLVTTVEEPGDRFRDTGIAPVPPGDVDALAAALLGLVDDRERRTAAGLAAMRFAEAHGSRAMVEGTLAAYETVARR